MVPPRISSKNSSIGADFRPKAAGTARRCWTLRFANSAFDKTGGALISQRYEIHGSAESGFVARQKSVIDRPDHPPTKLDLTGPKFFEVPLATTAKGGPQADAKESLTTTPLAAATMADDGSIVDVIVLYTPTARLSQTPGTTAQMNANIDAQIALTNQVYQNSVVTQRLRLVYKGEINYNEVNMDVDLPRLELTYQCNWRFPLLTPTHRAHTVTLHAVELMTGRFLSGTIFTLATGTSNGSICKP